MELKDRIKEAMDSSGLKAGELATKTGKTAGAVSQWLDGTTKSLKAQTAARIEAATGFRSTWLATGKGPKLVSDAAAQPEQPNTEQLLTSGFVPLISWVQAGCWNDAVAPCDVTEAEEWMPCPVRHSPQTYALRVRGDSMYNPEGRPSYSDGDIIFVDPAKDAKHGDRIVVQLSDHAEATFKQLMIEDGRRVLKALNPRWEPRYTEINGNATVVGVVIGKWVPE